MMFVICFALLFWGESLASHEVDMLFDDLIRELPEATKDIERDLPDFLFLVEGTTSENRKEVAFTDGHLSGLSTAYKHSQCNKPRDAYGIETLRCTLGFNDLEVSYKGRVTYGDIPPFTFHADAIIRNTLVDVGIKVSPNGDYEPKLAFFYVRNPGVLEPTFRGLGILESHMKSLKDYYKQFSPIVDALKYRLEKAFNKAVSRLPHP